MINSMYTPILPTATEHSFPSGKIVFANDLRSLFGDIPKRFDATTPMGRVQTTQYYAERGLYLSFASNGNFTIRYDEATRELSSSLDDTTEGVALGTVCTNAWVISIMDYDLFVELGGELDAFDVHVGFVAPGRYIGLSYAAGNLIFRLQHSDAPLPASARWCDAFTWLNELCPYDLQIKMINDQCFHAQITTLKGERSKIITEHDAAFYKEAGIKIVTTPCEGQMVKIHISNARKLLASIIVALHEFNDLTELCHKIERLRGTQGYL